MAISKFTLENGLQVTGSSNFSGSVSSSGGFTGSLFGTASYGQDTNLLDGYDSSAFALTGSTNYFKASQIVSGNLVVTASLTASSLTASDLNIDYIDFVPQATNPAQQTGRIFVDNVYNEINTWTDVTDVNLLLGQQLVLRAKCTDMATFTKGQVVKINGGTGANATFVTASWDNDSTSADTLGFLMNSGVTNDFAYIIINGYLTGINTGGYTPGQVIFLSSSGNYTNTAPTYPYHEVRLGQIVRAHASVGSIFVRVQNGYELGELHDVYTSSLNPGDLLVYEDGANNQWTNKKQLTGSYGLTGSLTASVGLSGALGLFPTLTGSSISGTTAQYTTISGSNMSGALIGTLNGVSAILAGTNLTASTVATVRTVSLTSSITSGLTLLTSTTGNFTILSGTTTTGSTALFTTISGTTTTGSTALFGTITGSNTTGSVATFTTITGSTITGSTLSYTTLNTTQITSSGKILVDNALTIGNGAGSYVSNIAIGNSPLASVNNPMGIDNIAIGYQPLALNQSGNLNVAIGKYALYNTNGAWNNVALGGGAGQANTNGTENVFIGTGAGYAAKASNNTLIGTSAGANLKTSDNVGIGYYALNSHADNLLGGGNFSLGSYAWQQLVSGTANVAIGAQAGYGTKKGSYNILLGGASMAHGYLPNANATASYNIGIGYGTLGSINYNADDNIAIGYQAGAAIVSGTRNIALGKQAYYASLSGNNNIAIGYNSLLNMTTGSNNIAIGSSTATSVVTGNANVYIGNYAGVNNVSNNIYISDGDGNLRLQIDSAGKVGIGTASPATELDVRGTGSFYSIKFPAVQSASSDVNTLDDYEEGTWIPAFSSSTTTNFSYDSAATSGSYVKIGKNVSLNGYLKITSTGSSAGNLYIQSLPFAIPAGTTNYYSLNIGYHANLSGTVAAPIGYGALGSSVMPIYKNTLGSATQMSVTDLTNTAAIMFSINYNVS